MVAGMECSAPDCTSLPSKGGLCNKHYIRLRRHGSFDTPHPMKVGNHCHGECPGAKRIGAHLHYLSNKDAYKTRTKAYSKLHYHERSAYFQDPVNQERARQRTKVWSAKNAEHKRQYDKNYSAAHPSLVRSYKAARRARERNATPSWLTAEHWQQIRVVYAEADKLTWETGIQYEVDHIVPLSGKTVCGLHVPWNLRAIPKVHNNRRSRVWTGSDDYVAT